MNYYKLKKLLNLKRLLLLAEGYGFGAHTIKKEVKLVSKLNSNLKIVFDVGANKGLYSFEIKKKHPNSIIHLFEPNKSNYEKIMELNQKMIVNNLAVSNSTGEKILYSNENGSGLASLSKRRLDHFDLDFNIEEKVKSIKLSDYINENKIEHISLLKIDVEGHEMDVLNSLQNKISLCEIIQFEFGGANIDTKTYFQDFYYFFKNKDFTIYRVTPFKLKEVKSYSELNEIFLTTNYICVNNKWN